MADTHSSTANSESAGTPLQLRNDDFITTAFVVKTILVLAILLAMAYAILRWLSARMPGTYKSEKVSAGNVIRVISSMKISIKTKVVFIEIDDHKAVIVETQQGSKLEWLPSTSNKPECEKGEI